MVAVYLSNTLCKDRVSIVRGRSFSFSSPLPGTKLFWSPYRLKLPARYSMLPSFDGAQAYIYNVNGARATLRRAV